MMRQRFAPSPTGFLHLGHAFSALSIWDEVRAKNGEMLLRIEDIDTARARSKYIAAIYQDLHWLGLDWPGPVLRQSRRMPAYQTALNQLISRDLCYPCRCTRKDIASALSAPQEGVITNSETAVYPGTCRNRQMSERGENDAVRLNMVRAIAHLGGAGAVERLLFTETGPKFAGTHHLSAMRLIKDHGDVVLARRDIGTSYHLAVVVDDAAQGITHVTRGRDMFDSTPIHRLLQALLGLPTPVYHHHRLIRDGSGLRLAKRDDARAIRKFRQNGATPGDIRRVLGLGDGIG